MATLNQAKIIKGLENLTNNLNQNSFFFDFLKVFGFSQPTIQKLIKNDRSRNIGIQDGDYGLTKQIYFRSIKRNQNARTELDELLKESVIETQKVRFVIVTNFKTLVAFDARVEDSIEIDIEDLRSNYDFFLPLTGKYEKPLAYSTHPADTKACEKMGRLYDIIRQLNHYDESNLHTLNVFLTRLLFCFFAEDTGIFPIEGQMTQAIESMTQKDGKDLPEFFTDLFAVLDLPEKSKFRKDYPATLRAFPYVNGGLFKEKCAIPKMNAKARNILLDCGRLTWADISPVIFGSMFQSVMDPELRHELGAHYTSEKNIFKVIGPLFLDDLKAELEGILELKQGKSKLKKLQDFQNKLASIVCLDPAAGCGNFLIVAYRELKQLELQAVEAMLSFEKDKDKSLFMTDWAEKYSKVSINQFYGIEIEEFPVDVARVSMWLMEHVMNRRFGERLGTVIPSIPLRNSAHIICANSLTTAWDELVPIDKLTYIISNPPFNGASTMSKAQKAEVLSVFPNVRNAGILDYVTAWYGKASECLQLNENIECAFVSTNSICQGEQVAPLWGYLFEHNIHINFAHQTFQWRNEAKQNAGVYCVVIGFSKKNKNNKKLFLYETPKSEPIAIQVHQINGYLLDANEQTFIESSNAVLSAPYPMVRGNQPTDGGNLIIEAEDFDSFWAIEELRPYIKKLIGSKELLHSLPRYCLWLPGAPKEILEIPQVSDRIEGCRKMRLASRDPGCRKLAVRSHEFRDINNPETAIVIPCHSSERRDYVPMNFVDADSIVTNANMIVPNGTIFDFGILESRMHMTWMRTVCGRLKSDYRYSRDLCYNTFPWPQVNQKQREQIENLATNVLIAREMHPEMTLAELYDPDKMPDDLKKAHQELDMAVDRLYRKKGFENDEDRLQHLFKRYEALVNGEDVTLFED